MKSLGKKVFDFCNAECGATAVEYAVMLALVIGLCVFAITAVGAATNEHMTDAQNGLSQALSK